MKYFLALFIGLSITANCQKPASKIFSHNDYLQKIPFETAYNLKVGFVEADVFLQDGELMVAHTGIEIRKGQTLEKLYLTPIKNKIRNNGGAVYRHTSDSLTLMIDLKTDGVPTLNAIVNHLKKYPKLTSCKTLTIAISGNVPDTAQWKNFPAYITFDGRPDKNYTKQHLQRVSFISNNFRAYSSWNGKGEIPEPALTALKDVISSVHSQGKQIRFWGSPDVPAAWEAFVNLGVDILGTDKIEELASFLKSK
jgi:alkaline phosphatase